MKTRWYLLGLAFLILAGALGFMYGVKLAEAEIKRLEESSMMIRPIREK